MTTINYSIVVRECGKGMVRIVGICNGPHCSTCLTLEGGTCISIDMRDYDKGMIPVTSSGHDYVVHISKEVA
jgi:hypothetical protein